MADQKISELTAAGALAGTEAVPVVQGGVSVRTTVQDIANLAPGGTPAASAVTYDNTTSGLTATNVQAAIDEIAADVAALTPENIFADSRWQYTDFSTNAVAALNIWTASNSFVSGSFAVNFESGFGGVWEITGGSSAGAGYRIVPPNFSLSIFSGLAYRCIFKTAATATDKGAFLGFVAPTQNGNLPANGLLLDYDATTQNATFTARETSVSTTAATSYAMLADTWYVCDIVVAASSARCILRLINGTVVYDETVSSGIPYNDVTKIVVPGAAFINRSLASAQIGKIDYIGYGVTKPSWMILP